MSKGDLSTARPDLAYAASVIALAIGMATIAFLIYYLVDVLLVLFLGIVVAAALQPGHLWLARWGIPKGLAVLLFYGLFLVVTGAIALLVVPALFDQCRELMTGVPERYAHFVGTLKTSSSPFLQQLGLRLPPFTEITERVTALFPTFFTSVLQFMTGAVGFFVFFVGVLAIGFYWTIELPRIERVVVSLFPVARRPQVLAIWHEVEEKLGGFIRGQGLAMLIMGAAAGMGYWLIGLPHVLILAVFAGVFEAVPMVGPVLAAIPAVLLALPQGGTTVALAVGFYVALHVFESNALIPRIMSHSVGVSSLLGLFTILAFGKLYGVLGALVAIPLTVVMQVLLNHTLINPDPVAETVDPTAQPVEALRAQLQGIRHRIHARLQERDSRMQLQPTGTTADQVADTVEQQLERSVEQVETMLTALDQDTANMQSEERQRAVATLRRTVSNIESTLRQIDTTLPEETNDRHSTEVRQPVLAELNEAVAEVEQRVQHAGTVVSETKEEAAADTGPMKNVKLKMKNVQDN